MRTLLLSVLVVLALPMPAGAVTLVYPDGSRAEPFQTWAENSLVPTTDQQIVVRWECESSFAQGCSSGRTVGVSIALPTRERRYVFFHELGHQFDRVMPEWKRERFRIITGLPRDSVWMMPGWDSPGEMFAEAYAFAAMYKSYRSLLRAEARDGGLGYNYGYVPSRRTFGRIGRLIRMPQ